MTVCVCMHAHKHMLMYMFVCVVSEIINVCLGRMETEREGDIVCLYLWFVESKSVFAY